MQTSTYNLLLQDTGVQYSALTENSETDYISEGESLPEEIWCHYHDTECKYTEIPQDTNRMSNPILFTQTPGKH